jgi:ketosteroid isomerase-like protein
VLNAYQFLDAVNERDADALAALVADDAELRLSDDRVWRGTDGARALIEAAEDQRLRLIGLHREEHAEDRDGGVWVELRVREVTEEHDVPRIADFFVRDGDVASFALRPAAYEPGLA